MGLDAAKWLWRISVNGRQQKERIWIQQKYSDKKMRIYIRQVLFHIPYPLDQGAQDWISADCVENFALSNNIF